MPGWKVHTEEKDHFVVTGNGGDFRIHKANLSPTALASMQKLCKGGKAKRLADGGEVKDDDKKPDKKPAPPPNSSPSVFDASKKIQGHNAQLDAALNGEGMADGGEAPPAEPMPPPDPDGAGAFAEDTTNTRTLAEQEESAQAAAPAEQPYTGPMARPPDDAPVEAQPAPAQSEAYRPPSPGTIGPAGVLAASRETEGAIRAKGAVEQTNADEIATKQENQAREQRGWLQIQQEREANNRTALGKMLEDLQSPNSNIKADHFWADKSTGDKLRIGIGMILSGIGSGLTGQPNMAAQFIQRSIDRDIDAQKANLSKKEGVYSFYAKMMQDDRAAYLMTHAVLTNVAASELNAAATRAGGSVAAQTAKVAAAQAHEQAIHLSNQASLLQTQSQMQRIQLEHEVRNENLLRSVFGGKGGSPDQKTIAEAGARGLVKPVVLDRQGTLGIARSDSDAQKLNEALPHYHAAQDVLDKMQAIRDKYGAANIALPTDAGFYYDNLRRELGVSMEKALAGRVSSDTIKAQVESMGSDIKQFVHSKDPLAAVRQMMDAQHRALVNQHTWSREQEPAPRGGRAPPVSGAVHVTNGQTGAWLPPGKALPAGWRRD